MTFASILLEVSIDKALDYSIPAELIPHIQKGVSVEVPLRNKLVQGFVVNVKDTSEVLNPKAIKRALTQRSVVTLELFELALWMARYYVCPLGKVLKTMLPAGVRKNTKNKEPLRVYKAKTPKELREVCTELRTKAPQQAEVLDCMLKSDRDGILLSELLENSGAPASAVKALETKKLIRITKDAPFEEYFISKAKTLSDEQQKSLDSIVESLKGESFSTHLLFGITGSGKTEVYLQAIDKALEMGKGVILLVPEIALTEQTIHRFKSRFTVPLAVLHHRLSDGERMKMWEDIQSGHAKICIGARSSLFCPMPNLGLIIVDEEHEQSYKQSDDSPCYHARDVAVMRAKLEKATCLLGSATPSLESYYNAQNGKYKLHTLTKRPASATLPTVTIIDMKPEYAKAKAMTIFSEKLLAKIEEKQKLGEQTILFLNRRGYHTILSCTSCGNSIKCCHCDTTLTFHKGDKIIACHLCGFSSPPPKMCPHCAAHDMIKYQGTGTEKVESMLHGIFGSIRTLRIDADTTRHKGSLEKLLSEFRSGKADVLIGTQMVAKGLHFPQVTLVGVLNSDASLNIPDFRAQETVFQLITQVAGRAGRGETPGEVLIQTAMPENSTIQLAAKQDFVGFYTEEIGTREAFYFPPFAKIVKILFSGSDEERVSQFARRYQIALKECLGDAFICHPVVPSGYAKVKDLFRYQFLIRGPAINAVCQAIEHVDRNLILPSAIRRFIDVDPLHFA